MGFVKNASLGKYRFFLLLASTIFYSGCSTSPLFQTWDFSVKPDFLKIEEHSDAKRIALIEQLKQIEKDRPEWKNTLYYSTFIVRSYSPNRRQNGRPTEKFEKLLLPRRGYLYP